MSISPLYKHTKIDSSRTKNRSIKRKCYMHAFMTSNLNYTTINFFHDYENKLNNLDINTMGKKRQNISG